MLRCTGAQVGRWCRTQAQAPGPPHSLGACPVLFEGPDPRARPNLAAAGTGSLGLFDALNVCGVRVQRQSGFLCSDHASASRGKPGVPPTPRPEPLHWLGRTELQAEAIQGSILRHAAAPGTAGLSGVPWNSVSCRGSPLSTWMAGSPRPKALPSGSCARYLALCRQGGSSSRHRRRDPRLDRDLSVVLP